MSEPFIRNKLLFLFAVATLLLSSCGLLFRYRSVRHKGLDARDFGLPVVVYSSAVPAGNKMVVLLSGDGGWLDFSDKLAVEFSRKGFNTIGFNSRSYFWQQRSPEEAARDLAKLITRYAGLWKARQIILSGFSFGADVTPFIYNRLPDNLKNRVVALQLMSPFLSTDFKVYLTDAIYTGKDNRTYKVRNELKKVKIPIYCFYGEEEQPKSLIDVKKKNFFLKLVPGNHDYVNAWSSIVTTLGAN